MAKKETNEVAEKLDKVIEVLQHLVVLELARQGASRKAIGKNVRMATSKVVKLLADTKRGGSDE